MLRIRLRRVGKRGKPSYRIVVADVRAPRDGAYLEWIGNYDPMADPPAVTIKRDRAEEWLSKGAQPSDAVKRILQWQDILEREPLNRTPQRKKAEEASAVPAPAPAATAVAEDEAPAEEADTTAEEEVSGGSDEPEEAASGGDDQPAAAADEAASEDDEESDEAPEE